MDGVGKQIETFLAAPAFAVAGASDDTYKYGHKCYKCYLQHGLKAYPLNPNCQTVMGNPCYPDLASLPEPVESLSIITPPAVTEKVIDDAIKCGVKNIWLQPGAESRPAIERAQKAGIEVIYGGPCLLVVLGYRGP